MDDIHVSRELYEAVERGELPRDFLEEIQSEHLLARCPHCRAGAEAYAFRRKAGLFTWSRYLQSLSLLIPQAARCQELTVEKLRELVAWLRRSVTDQKFSLDSLPWPASFPPARPAG